MFTIYAVPSSPPACTCLFVHALAKHNTNCYLAWNLSMAFGGNLHSCPWSHESDPISEILQCDPVWKAEPLSVGCSVQQYLGGLNLGAQRASYWVLVPLVIRRQLPELIMGVPQDHTGSCVHTSRDTTLARRHLQCKGLVWDGMWKESAQCNGCDYIFGVLCIQSAAPSYKFWPLL